MLADRIIAWSLAIALATFPVIAGAQSPQVRQLLLRPLPPPPAAGGGPAFDAVGSGQRSGGAGSLTWTHTPVGTPTGVAVGVINFNPNCTISGVSYGASSMGAAAQSNTQGNSGPFDQNDARLYGLANPPSGAQTVTVSFSAGTNCFVAGASITVTGGNTTTVFRASNSAKGTSTTPSVSVTSSSGDLVVDFVMTADGAVNTTAAGGSQTSRVANLTSGGNRESASTLTASGASTNMSWTIASSNSWVHSAASFQP